MNTSRLPAIKREHVSAAMTLIGQAQAARAMGTAVWKWYDQRRSYVVTVRSDDRLYPAVHAWLLSLLPPTQQRTLLIRTIERWEQDKRITNLATSYDDAKAQIITVNGHRIKVQLKRAGSGDGKSQESEDRMLAAMTQPDVITFTAHTEVGQRAVLDHLAGLHDERTREDRRPTLRTLSKWNEWVTRSDLPARELDSVVLAAGQMENLVDDIGRFLDTEIDYNRRGLPYHRGLLLEGPPGTGKTSVVKALANHFALDLWAVPLGDVNKDTKLLDLVAQVSPRSMLLLEDVDVFAATRERDKESGEKGLSLSGLLNALDGVATPHGLITVLTTNRPDVLDPALIRPGRIDRREVIGYPDAEQTARLFQVFYGHTPSGPVDPAGKSPAELLEVFKRHEDDPALAEAVLRGWMRAA